MTARLTEMEIEEILRFPAVSVIELDRLVDDLRAARAALRDVIAEDANYKELYELSEGLLKRIKAALPLEVQPE